VVAVATDLFAAADAVPAARIARAWQALGTVEDPEIPALKLVDLGVIRFVRAEADGALRVGLTPTYSGCPATEVIRQLVEEALIKADIGEFALSTQLSPAWSSDWITPAGRAQLLAYGIVPPEKSTSLRDMRRATHPLACPRCQSMNTETLSEFGSTPCKALHRCNACLEPFEYFKCI
jgi:ring-1,2-phenylacetyl-CoA epoxidase subunit PaaD